MPADDLEFRTFFSAHFGALCWLGYLLTGDRSQAEELAQEAMVRTLGRWRVRRPDDPVAYARRVLINRHRSVGRRALLELRHTERLRREQRPAPGLGEDAVIVWAAMRRLPERQRLVLALRYHEDLSEAEVARLLRLPLGTVKTLARRGLARLRGELGPAADDFVPTQEQRA